MSAINVISPGSVPAIPQPAAAAAPTPGGTIPATGNQTSGAQSHGDSGKAVTPASPDQLQKAIDKMNQKLEGSGQSVRIGYASAVHRLTVEVVDNATGQVVGQFPSKAVIEHEAAMEQFIGLMVSKEA